KDLGGSVEVDDGVSDDVVSEDGEVIDGVKVVSKGDDLGKSEVKVSESEIGVNGGKCVDGSNGGEVKVSGTEIENEGVDFEI
ncbi:hypothetical protein Tco_1222364, partial [Tanacetum coccineum]